MNGKHLKRTLMLGAIAVAGTLALATPTLARDHDSMNGQNATSTTTSGMSGTAQAGDADDMTRGTKHVTGNRISQGDTDADDKARTADRDDKVRADADNTKKGTDADERSARANDRDGDDVRTGRNNTNANGRFAADRDRGLDRAADRHERHYFMRASYRHYRHHYHVVLRDRDRDLRTMNDRDRDDMRTNDHDDMKSPSGH